jgi:hypothetical protein
MGSRERRDAFVARVRGEGGDAVAVIVPAAAFLDGNDDEASLAPNLGADHPGMDTVRAVLERLAGRPDVAGAYVELDHLEYDVYPEEEWPYASVVHVVTTAPVPVVAAEVAELRPDDVSVGTGTAGVEVPPGYQVISIWWD